MIPYTVLGVYHPTRWRASVIGPELCEFTRSFTSHDSPSMLQIQDKASWKSDDLHASVCRFAVLGREGYQWHQDGDHAPGANMSCGLILWANREPTEIKGVTDSVVYQPQPFEVVLFSNMQCYHRRPPNTEGKRWVFRRRVQL